MLKLTMVNQSILNASIVQTSSFPAMLARYTLMALKYRISIRHERAACSIRWGIASGYSVGGNRVLLGKVFVSKASETVCLRRITLTPGHVVHTIYTIFILLFRDRVSLGKDPVFTRREGRTRNESEGGAEGETTTLGTEVSRVPYTFHEVHFPTKLLDDVHATSFRQDRRERLHTEVG